MLYLLILCDVDLLFAGSSPGDAVSSEAWNLLLEAVGGQLLSSASQIPGSGFISGEQCDLGHGAWPVQPSSSALGHASLCPAQGCKSELISRARTFA